MENLLPSKATGIRFVVACPNGHLDDVDWPRLVHKYGNHKCEHEIFRWIGEGQSAQDLIIECQKCDSKIRLSQIYRLSREDGMDCSGRFAESKHRSEPCTVKARLLLRSGSNLRISEVLVNLTIPYRDSVNLQNSFK